MMGELIRVSLIVRAAVLVVWLVFFIISSVAHAGAIKDIRVWQSPSKIRYVVEFNDAFTFKKYSKKGKVRIEIQTKKKLLPQLLQLLHQDQLFAPVQSVAIQGNSIRLLLANTKAKVEVFSLQPKQPYGPRLIIDIRDGQKQQKLNFNPNRKITIVIDPGHGGEDPGGVYNGVFEKDLALIISRKVHNKINKDANFSALLVRNADYYVSLQRRLDFARRVNADLLVSIHLNVYKKESTVSGMMVFAPSNAAAKSEIAAYMENKENESDEIGGVDLAELSSNSSVLQQLLLDLSYATNIDRSMTFGQHLIDIAKPTVHLFKNPLEQAGFLVLKSPEVPSVLVETGFLSNPNDAKLLTSNAYQDIIASAISLAVRSWFYTHPPSKSILYQHATRRYLVTKKIMPQELALKLNINEQVLLDDNVGVISKKTMINIGKIVRYPRKEPIQNPAIQSKTKRKVQKKQQPKRAVKQKKSTIKRIYYSVQPNDTIQGIATQYGVGIAEIMAINNLEQPLIYAGQTIMIDIGK